MKYHKSVGIDEIERKIGELEKEKGKLFAEIIRINGRIRYKSFEEKALAPYLKRKEDVRPGRLYSALDEVEFRIATEAYTPKIEKEMIKEARKIKEGLKEAVVVAKMRKRHQFVKNDIEKLEEERKGVEKRLEVVRNELSALYAERKNEEKKKRDRAGWTDYMRPIDRFVSIGDICTIEKEE